MRDRIIEKNSGELNYKEYLHFVLLYRKFTKMETKKVLNRPKKKKKIFNAQVICSCNRKCAEIIDVVVQKDIFDHYHSLKIWSEKTLFLRTIVKRVPVKENLNPRMILKKREYFSSYWLNDENGQSQRVCSVFVERLLQIQRAKVFRAVSSTAKNPSATDLRGKMPKKRSDPADILFMEHFIQTLPCYESKIKPNLSPIKYFHPNLTLNKIYELYTNSCIFKQCTVLSKNIFNKVLKDRFNHLMPFKPNSVCRQCSKFKALQKRKVLSLEQKENIEKQKGDHESEVKNVKKELLQCIEDSIINQTEVLTFELQRPHGMPCLSIEESYDWRQLWFSNLCIYDQVCQTSFMYVWDEPVSFRGPEEVASCVLKHIFTVVPKTASKVILYSKSCSLYRNMQMSLMLKKVGDYMNNSSLKTIEQRFFLEGHDSNDCSRCFEAIDKQKKSTLINTNLFAPNDYAQLIASAKRTEPQFKVIQMTENDFFSVAQLMKFVIDDKHSATGKQIHWSSISTITYTLSEPLNLCNRYINKESMTLLLSNQDVDEFRSTGLIYSSKGGKAISKIKYENLQMNLSCIPIEHHEYYKSIKFNDSTLDQDFALASYDSADEYMNSDEEK